jgi:TPP-dependent pyruvate/acetoin dehydrogenase alpha subunit
MTHGHTRESLVAFEDRVAAAFERKEIRGPIHLCSDEQANPLLDLFRDVGPNDWVLSTWRSHWHCLLKGVPEEDVYAACLDGRSMFLNFAGHRVICSAIVGWILPIAVGLGMAIKRQGGFERVHCFLGDMAGRTGLYHESVQYATGHGLPVRFIVEDNGCSTNANTDETWGRAPAPRNVERYRYTRNRPHTGTGRHVTF